MAINFDSDGLRNFAAKADAWSKRLRFGNKAQLAFLEDFYVLVNDGIPPNRAIDMMCQVTQGITREVALAISQKISQGQGLADGMRDWFNVNIVEIIRVGEEGGALAETMKSAINTLTQRRGVLGSFIASISYPLFVILVASGVIVYLDVAVFIQFRAIKPESQWPDAGRQLVFVANMIERGWWLLLILTAALIIGLNSAMNNYVGAFRSALDKMPPFSLYRRFIAARFMETLGLLVANGVMFKQAIKVMQYQASPYLSSHLVTKEVLLGKGKGNIADVLDTGLIDEVDILRLRVLAEVKGFEHGLIRMGIRGTEEGAQTMKIISKVIGGILLAIGAALILIIIRGIYLTGMSMGTG